MMVIGQGSKNAMAMRAQGINADFLEHLHTHVAELFLPANLHIIFILSPKKSSHLLSPKKSDELPRPLITFERLSQFANNAIDRYNKCECGQCDPPFNTKSLHSALHRAEFLAHPGQHQEAEDNS